MTPDEQAEMERLVRLIEVEKDPTRFTQLVEDLIALLGRKERRIKSQSQNA